MSVARLSEDPLNIFRLIKIYRTYIECDCWTLRRSREKNTYTQNDERPKGQAETIGRNGYGHVAPSRKQPVAEIVYYTRDGPF